MSTASLGTDPKTVTLTTTTLSEGVTYTLTVNNVKDQAVVPNTIVSGSQKTFEMNTSLYEAEKMDLISPMTLGSGTNASGGQYISPTSGTNSTSPQPEATLSFNVAQADTYYLWIRMMGPDPGSDALYIGIDTTWDRVYPGATNVYEWIRVENSLNSGNYGFNLTAGNHTFQIGHGEINTRADALYLTNDANKIPSTQVADKTPPTPPVGVIIQ